MPTYEYECQKCGHEFERFESMTAKPLRTCPECRGKVKRLVGTGAGVIFKGTGFYHTDYRTKNYKDGARGDVGSVSTKKVEPSPAKDTKSK